MITVIIINILNTCILLTLYDIIKSETTKENIVASVEQIKEYNHTRKSKNKFKEFKNKKGLYEPYKPTGKRESDS